MRVNAVRKRDADLSNLIERDMTRWCAGSILVVLAMFAYRFFSGEVPQEMFLVLAVVVGGVIALGLRADDFWGVEDE